jgi:hypothetical protein
MEIPRPTRVLRGLAWSVLVSVVISGQTPRPADRVASARFAKKPISYAEATPVLKALPDSLPREFKGKSPAEIEAAWPGWVLRHDSEIRSRIERGDEDSLVNFWLFGTSFTRLAPARDSDIGGPGGLGQLGPQDGLAEVLRRRLDDLVNAMASPGVNGRIQFARQFVERKGLDPTTARGKVQVRQLLVAARDRAIAEYRADDRTLVNARNQPEANAEIAAYATIFRDRGLSSDTSVLADFAIEQTLRALKRDGIITGETVRRAAVVGPGLDVLNKADGHDFYPPQTIQPFALVDSLLRLELARDDLRITTFDLNPRVNDHLEQAVRSANAGKPYALYLPLARRERWTPDLMSYWSRAGDQIGEAEPADLLPDRQDVRLRALRVRPAVVQSIVSRDVNIVVERLEPMPTAERFDLVVATNIFVYYDPFEQALAVANIANMLRPGGVLLSNTLIVPTPPMRSSAAHAVITYSDRQYDHMFWYQRE